MLVALGMGGTPIEARKVIVIEVSLESQRLSAYVALGGISKEGIIPRASYVGIIRVLYDVVDQLCVEENAFEKLLHAILASVYPHLAKRLPIVPPKCLVLLILALYVVAKARRDVFVSSFSIRFEDALEICVDYKRYGKQLVPRVKCDKLLSRTRLRELQMARLVLSTNL
jgi:hypothetical protein